MKLRKLTQRITAAILAGAMALSLSATALAETAGISNLAASTPTLTVTYNGTTYTLYGTGSGETGVTFEQVSSSDGATMWNNANLPTVTYDSIGGFVFSGSFAQAVTIDGTGSEDVTLSSGSSTTVSGTLDMTNVNNVTITKDSNRTAAVTGKVTINASGDVTIHNDYVGDKNTATVSLSGGLTVNTTGDVDIRSVVQGDAYINTYGTVTMFADNAAVARNKLTVENASSVNLRAYSAYGVIGTETREGSAEFVNTGTVTLTNTATTWSVASIYGKSAGSLLTVENANTPVYSGCTSYIDADSGNYTGKNLNASDYANYHCFKIELPTPTRPAHKLTLKEGSNIYTVAADADNNITLSENWPNAYPVKANVSYDSNTNTFFFEGAFSNEDTLYITGDGSNVVIHGDEKYATKGALTVSDVGDFTIDKPYTPNVKPGYMPVIQGTANITCSGTATIKNTNYASTGQANFAVKGDLTVNASSVDVLGTVLGNATITATTVNVECKNGTAVTNTVTLNGTNSATITSGSDKGTIGHSGNIDANGGDCNDYATSAGKLVLDNCTGKVIVSNSNARAIYNTSTSSPVTVNGGDPVYYAGESEAKKEKVKDPTDANLVSAVKKGYFEITFEEPVTKYDLTLVNAKAYSDKDCNTELSHTTTENGTTTYSVDEGAKVYIQAEEPTTTDHWYFAGWSGIDQSYLSFEFTMPGEKTTLTANYVKMYQIYIDGEPYKANNGAEYFAPDATVAIKAAAPEKDTTDVGYVFEKWTKAEGSADFTYGTIGGQPCNDKQELTYIVMPTGDVRLKTNWIKYYSLTTDNCKLEGNRLSYPAGEEITITADETTTDTVGNTLKLSEIVVAPKESYTGDAIKATGSNGTYTFIMPAYPAVVTAKYETVKAKYILTLKNAEAYDGETKLDGTAGEDGTTTYEVEDGKELTIKAVAPDEDSQWKFNGWDGSEETSEEINVTVTGTTILTAKWVKQTAHTLTLTNAKAYTDETYTTLLEPTTEGGNEYSVEEGTMVYLKIENQEEAGEWISYWRSEEIEIDPDELHNEKFSFEMPSTDVKMAVEWYKLYNLIVNDVPYIFMDGTSTFTKGSDLALTARKAKTPDSDIRYEFICWEKAEGSAAFEYNYEFGYQYTENDYNVHIHSTEDGDLKLNVIWGDELSYRVIPDNTCELVKADENDDEFYKAGETVVIKAADAEQVLNSIKVTTKKDGTTISATKQEDGSFTFTMPSSPVYVTAGTDAPIPEPDTPDVPDTDGSGSAVGAVIAGAAIGGTVLFVGYEVVTDVVLSSLLPAGAATPANRGQLALLIWNTKGAPETQNQPAFTDVPDPEMAKAAQWCVEQGVMDAKSEDTFNPGGWVPKFKVIETWNKAFPQQ